VLDGYAEKRGVKREGLEGKTLIDARTGEILSADQARAFYSTLDFEAWLIIPERVEQMCRDLFAHLLAHGGPEQKTIVFCARDAHADAVATVMNNLYAAWCQREGRSRLEPYAFKCTAASNGGSYLPDFRGGERHHFVATTVDLLTTGVDVPRVRNVVFFKYVRSPIAFYQMVGRGTRIDVASGKLMFRVFDYTDATRLFGDEFLTKWPPRDGEREPAEPGEPTPAEPTIQVEGFDVQITEAGRFIITEVDGKAMPVTVEEYRERLAQKLVEEASTIERFQEIWINPDLRRDLFSHLPDGGRSPYVLRALMEMGNYDLYDLLADLGYGLAPHTRADRADAFRYKQKPWLEEMPAQTSAAVLALASQFARGGTEGLENPAIFQTPEIRRAGGLAALRAVGEPASILRETKERMFAV
jgi:type I restriction enzyme, R subunit